VRDLFHVRLAAQIIPVLPLAGKRFQIEVMHLIFRRPVRLDVDASLRQQFHAVGHGRPFVQTLVVLRQILRMRPDGFLLGQRLAVGQAVGHVLPQKIAQALRRGRVLDDTQARQTRQQNVPLVAPAKARSPRAADHHTEPAP